MTEPLPHADHPRVVAANALFDAVLPASARTDPRLARARRWSALAHASQVRPDGLGTPYAAHPLSVAARVATWCPEAPASVLAAALLHDTLEDQPEALVALARDEGCAASPEQTLSPEQALAAAFGENVLRVVQALTTAPPAAPGADKNEAYRAHVVHVVLDDPDAGPVKLSDLYDNALAIDGVSDSAKRAKLARKYRPVLVELAERLPSLGPSHPLAAAGRARAAELRAALATGAYATEG